MVLFLLLIITVATTYVLKSDTKTQQLQALSKITKLPNISISASHWEETELSPCLEKINYTGFTYAK